MSYLKLSAIACTLGFTSTLALLGSAALVVGCGSTASSPGAAPGFNGTGGTGASGGTAGGAPLPPDVCVTGIPATSQIPRLLNRQYANVMRDLLDVVELDGAPVSAALVGDFTGPMTAPAWQVYQQVAEKLAAQVMAGPSRPRFISCDPAAAGCLKTTIETFGRKAFRRALAPDEVQSFEALAKTTPPGTPEQVAEAILNAFLVAPSFLLLPELDVKSEGAAIQLSQQEVATRLSFLLWGSIPDEALNTAADGGQLQTKAQLLAQAERMIQVREKAGPLIAAFHAEWAQMNNGSGHWWKIDHDPTKYPAYTATAKLSFQKELDAFFEAVAYRDGSFKDLLLSNVAFVNQDNAAIYGLDAAQYGAELREVTLDSAAAPRPGFLTRAGFLSSYSNYDATSPILRGAFIAASLLNLNPGAPVPGAKDAKAEGTFTTQRAYVEALTEKAQPCEGCHAVINPLGYVLENYDGIGKWQTVDLRGGALDASVTTATVSLGDGVEKVISSPVQLMEELAKTPKAQELYARAWVSYAFGRAPNAHDQCLVDQLATRLAADGYTIRRLLAELTQADSFRLRVRETP